MGKTYIFGHRNPDTDTITSSLVMANFEKKIMVWKLKYQTPIHWLTRMYLLSYSLTFLLQRNHKEKKNLELLKKKKRAAGLFMRCVWDTKQRSLMLRLMFSMITLRQS